MRGLQRIKTDIVTDSIAFAGLTRVFAAALVAAFVLTITAIMGMAMIAGIGTGVAILPVSECVAPCREMPPGRAPLECHGPWPAVA